ncbi:MAG: alpha-amylase, partial [Lachnospiraceae bacterium]|nr:alpha-amylase [Lachnospiraceae bacterium]
NSALPLLLEDPYQSGTKFFVTDCPEGRGIADSFEERRVATYHDGFRNVMRRFVKGDENVVGEFVGQLCGEKKGFAQIRYIADQNGFSLYDLYAYDRKHNEANGEDNKDGEDYNHSWNCGVEGVTAKKKINALRGRLRKNALCTVFLSQSVPMLFAGDEFGHTKEGNNNAYCQDNEISWLNWRLSKERKELLRFTKELIAFRKANGILCGGRELRGNDWKNIGMPDVSYHGVQLWQPDFAPYSRTVSVLLSGAYGEREQEDLYLLFNMHWEDLQFALPTEFSTGKPENQWEKVLDTSEESELLGVNEGKEVVVTADTRTEYFCKVPARTVVVLARKQN